MEQLKHCYWIQVHSTHRTIGQWIRETRCWGKEETLMGEPADWEDGRLEPQNNHLTGGLDAMFCYRSERSNEELKSKGSKESEMQWGSKVKRSSVLQNISKGMSSLWKGINLFCSRVGRDKLTPGAEQRHLFYSQAKGQGPPGKPLSMIIIIIKASQRNSFQHGVRMGFLSATVLQTVLYYLQ